MTDCKALLMQIPQPLLSTLNQMSSLDVEINFDATDLEYNCLKYFCQQKGLLDLKAKMKEDETFDQPEGNQVHSNDPICSLPIGRSLARKLNLCDIQTIEQLSLVTPSAISFFQSSLNMQGPQKTQLVMAVDQARKIVARDLMVASRCSDSEGRAQPVKWSSIRTQHSKCMEKSSKKIDLISASQHVLEEAIKKIDVWLEEHEQEDLHRGKRIRREDPLTNLSRTAAPAPSTLAPLLLSSPVELTPIPQTPITTNDTMI
eukprot:c10859_g1_i1.p1 GENE.c10859_g1_i1~~c10859_g1_i1.p1  ORF type:complete len:291 (+),score=54.49 c10859_g1_i1:98-874(+)